MISSRRIHIFHPGSRSHSRPRSIPISIPISRAIPRAIPFPFTILTIVVVPHAHGLAVLRSSKAVHSVVVGVSLLVGAAASAPPWPIHASHVHSHAAISTTHSHAAIAHVHAISTTAHAITISSSHSAAHAVTITRAHSAAHAIARAHIFSRARPHTITRAHAITAIARSHTITRAHSVHHISVHDQVIDPILILVPVVPDLLCAATLSSTIHPVSTISGPVSAVSRASHSVTTIA